MPGRTILGLAPETGSGLNVVLPLWGLLWGCSLEILVVSSEMLGNAERMDAPEGCREAGAKLAVVSKIGQAVGTVGMPLGPCFLMDLTCC
jgi:hypothetical protein